MMMNVVAVATLCLLTAASPALGQQVDDTRGEWGPVFELEVMPIHAMLLPDGQVLLYGTDDSGFQGGDVFYAVWDPRTGQNQLASKLLRHETNVNIFCTTATLDVTTGNYVLIGGDDGNNFGVRDVLEFDSKTLELRQHPQGNMQYPRWYGTSASLPNGDILVVGGKSSDDSGSAVCEVWSPGSGFRTLEGTLVPAIASDINAWFYPIVLVNSSGDILIVITNGVNTDVYRIEVGGDGSIEKVGEKPFDMDELSVSVMFDVDRVMMIARDGGLWVGDISNGRNPSFTRTNDVGSGRTNGVANMLPDGRVIFTGGCAVDTNIGNSLPDAVRYVQIWNPKDNTIYRGASEDIARLYHSTALVMPDGTVFSGGGGAPGPLTNTNGNVYKPGYLFDPVTGGEAVRPVIQQWPQSIGAGASFELTVDGTENINMVTMTKAGAVTHSRNCDQRWLDLDFDVLDGRTIQVFTPGPNIMIGGLWTVNIISNQGFPSNGRLVGVNMDGISPVPPVVVPPPTMAPTASQPVPTPTVGPTTSGPTKAETAKPTVKEDETVPSQVPGGAPTSPQPVPTPTATPVAPPIVVPTLAPTPTEVDELLTNTAGLAMPVASGGGGSDSALCSANTKCAELGLAGLCCPSKYLFICYWWTRLGSVRRLSTPC